MVAYQSGDGVNAVGGVGVAWGEKVVFNMGSKVQTNVVNKRTCELWGILIACCIAEARKYARILIMTEEVSYTRKLLMNGKLDDDCKVIVEKIKEYSGKVAAFLLHRKCGKPKKKFEGLKTVFRPF